MFIQDFSTSSLILLLNESSKFEQLRLVFFVFDLDLVSPLRIDLSIFDLTSQEFQDFNLVLLEVLSVNQESFANFRGLSLLGLSCFAERLTSRN